jgi:hypothetical protein
MNRAPEHDLDDLDDLDDWLRREFEGPVADDGFATRVMGCLPPRPRRASWLLPATAIAGSLLAWLALAPSPWLELAAREALAADFGASSAVLLALLFGMGLLGCAWALEEGP